MIDERRASATSSVAVPALAHRNGMLYERVERVVVEEPLEIRLRSGAQTQRVAVTMRTPGADLELAAGFVLGEGIVPDMAAIAGVRHCDDRDLRPEERGNVVTVDVRGSLGAAALLERHFTISSACGVCGIAGIERLRERGYRQITAEARVNSATIGALPGRMRERQRIFEETGGLHAAALFTLGGVLLASREDIGRHNAVDKIAGWLAMNRRVDPATTILAVSGRCSYEIVQKSLAAGIPIVVSVSAASSLAIALAQAFGITLAAFVRDGRWNVHTHLERVAIADGSAGQSGMIVV